MFRQGIGEKLFNCRSKTEISTTTTDDDLFGLKEFVIKIVIKLIML